MFDFLGQQKPIIFCNLNIIMVHYGNEYRIFSKYITQLNNDRFKPNGWRIYTLQTSIGDQVSRLASKLSLYHV